MILSPIEVLQHISEKYGLTGLELVHYKGQENFPESMDQISVRLLSKESMSGILGVDFISAPNCLLIYEQTRLGVFIIVMRKKKEKVAAEKRIPISEDVSVITEGVSAFTIYMKADVGEDQIVELLYDDLLKIIPLMQDYCKMIETRYEGEGVSTEEGEPVR